MLYEFIVEEITFEIDKRFCASKTIEILGDILTKYRELNKKICDMLK